MCSFDLFSSFILRAKLEIEAVKNVGENKELKNYSLIKI